MSTVIRSYVASDFPPERVLGAKRGQRISVCIPARNEESTIGKVVGVIQRELVARHIVDELVVIDDGSSDATASVASNAGATVVSAREVLVDHGVGHGKGQALWRGLHVSTGDIVVYCDADITNLDSGFILGLVGPLLLDDELAVVKGFYERPLEGVLGEGGRVTELVARPLIALLFPHLGPLVQPLAGEFAGRRDVLESIPFMSGYAVDLALLIDIADDCGPGAIAQCDLGTRTHRNRPLAELGPQSLEIIQMVLSRAGVGAPLPCSATLTSPGSAPRTVRAEQLPPLRDVPAHRKSA